MADETKENRVPLSQVTDVLEKEIENLDAVRASGLEHLETMRKIKSNRLSREQTRLALKYGAGHPRTAAAKAKLQRNEELIAVVSAEAKNARTKITPVGENTWVLHGHLRNRKRAGIRGLTVTLVDQRGRPAEDFATATTDKAGYFRIEHRIVAQPAPAPAPAKAVLIRVTDDKDTTVHVDKEPLTPQSRAIDYREITIDLQPRPTPSPEPGPRPTPAPRPTPTPTPKPTPTPRPRTEPDPAERTKRKKKGE